MKIIYHHRTLGDGAEGIHVREMIRAFRMEGHEVKVTGPVGEREVGKGARGAPGLLSRIKRALPGFVYELMELAYGFVALFSTALHALWYRPDFIYDRYITFNFGVVLAGRCLGIPVLLEVNAPLALERAQQKDEMLVFSGLAEWLERRIYRLASRVIVVSTPLREHLESDGVPVGKCVVMPNGANPEHFAVTQPDHVLRNELGIPPGAFVIGFTGVLRGWHDLDLLVNALTAMPAGNRKACLLIVGDGPYRLTLQKMVDSLGLKDAVFITGLVPHAQVPRYVSLFDAAVCPGATFYASPMKLLEYMAVGKAVVVPDTANFLDMIEPEIDGLVFHRADGAALARQLERLRDSEELCASLGSTARRKIETRLNWRWNARACVALIEGRGA